MISLLRVRWMLAWPLILACSPSDVAVLRLPEPARPLDASTIEGEWHLRRSVAVSAANPTVRRAYAAKPDSANVQVFRTGGVFHEPRAAARDGWYRIAGDTILIVMADKDSTLWTGVKVSAKWLIQTTDHGAIDFDGDGRAEWANVTYLYERAP
jgi:hypothetical protein